MCYELSFKTLLMSNIIVFQLPEVDLHNVQFHNFWLSILDY